MPKQIVNGIDYSDGFDPQTYAKIGTSNLHTTATNLSDAVNELNSKLENPSINANYANALYNKSTTSWSEVVSYTATQPCIAYLELSGDGSTYMYALLNGSRIYPESLDSARKRYATIFLKPGDTLSKRVETGLSQQIYFYMIVWAYTIESV